MKSTEPGWGPSYGMSEASRLTQVPPHILRYWENERLLNPSRTSRGHRRYRQSDIEKISKIKEYFYVKKMRLEGVRKALSEEARKKRASSELPLELTTQGAASAILEDTKGVLREILQILK